MKLKKFQTIIFFIVSLLFVFTIVFLSLRHIENTNNYETQKITDFKDEINSVFLSYEDFSRYVYETKVENNTYILEIVNSAYQSDETTQATLRTELYNYLIEDYNLLQTYDFRQFHFHFPDSTSFLRLHSPDKFGDSLYDIRYSIRAVNEQKIFFSGFEEGRIFNGYRYVYPLSYQNNHIGSVEISVSMASVINTLTDVYASDYCFWMKKTEVESIVFIEEQDNYQISNLSEDYLVDLGVLDLVETRNLFSTDELEEIYGNLSNVDLNKIENNEEFLVDLNIDKTNYIITFVKINNIENNHIGYMASISVDDTIVQNRFQFIFNIVLVLMIYIIFIYLMSLTFKKNEILESTLMIDKLTNIYNRRKFENDFHNLIKQKDDIDFCIALLDIDDFKFVNDNYGHNIGDTVLKELSIFVQSFISPKFTFARYGGEEFTILMPNLEKDEALEICENIRKKVSELKFMYIPKITISIGLVCSKTKDIKPENMVDLADKAMYKAKAQGKNKVVFYENFD